MGERLDSRDGEGFGSLDHLRATLPDATAPIHRVTVLEAALDASPDDAAAPRGVLVALQLAGRDAEHVVRARTVPLVDAIGWSAALCARR